MGSCHFNNFTDGKILREGHLPTSPDDHPKNEEVNRESPSMYPCRSQKMLSAAGHVKPGEFKVQPHAGILSFAHHRHAMQGFDTMHEMFRERHFRPQQVHDLTS